MLRTQTICAGMILAASALPACGQPAGASAPTADERPRERVERIFRETSPAVGDPLPDVTIYDARGREFPLRSLRGQHTVLMFGCLT